MTHATQRPTSPEIAELRRQLLRLVRCADLLDHGSRIQLAGHLDEFLDRIVADSSDRKQR